jgi:tetratricopeptide (TPR) repeat protein
MKITIPLILLAIMLLAGPAFPESGEYFYERGMIEYEGKQYTFAQEDMERALEEDPKLYRAANILADLFLKRQKPVKALAYYRQSLQINDASRIFTTKPENSANFSMTAQTRSRISQSGGARSGHRTHILALVRIFCLRRPEKRRDHSQRATDRQKDGEAYLEKARREERRGKTARPSPYMKKPSRKPRRPGHYFIVSELSRRLRDYARAVECVQKAVRIRPDLEKGFVHLATFSLRSTCRRTKSSCSSSP